MAHPEGELATARACNELSCPMILSSNSNTLIEEVAKCNPNEDKYFQIYVSKVLEVNLDIWKRVKDAGYKGFVLTCDTQLLGKRERDVRNKFTMPSHLTIANYDKYSADTGAGDITSSAADSKQSTGSALADFMNTHKDNQFGWEII